VTERRTRSDKPADGERLDPRNAARNGAYLLFCARKLQSSTAAAAGNRSCSGEGIRDRRMSTGRRSGSGVVGARSREGKAAAAGHTQRKPVAVEGRPIPTREGSSRRNRSHKGRDACSIRQAFNKVCSVKQQEEPQSA
jgi:hypothetical protein